MIEHLSNIRGVGVGAGALDFFRPRGELGDDHQEGTKPGWADTDDQLLTEILKDPRVERHTGGNIINVLAYLACQRAFGELSFLGVIGDEQNQASQAINHTLKQFRVVNLAKIVPGYQPSVSIIETRAEPGSDRMVRGRPRDDMTLEDEHIRDSLHDKGLVIVSSLKKAELFNRVLETVPDEAILSYNPGSTELYADPVALRNSLLGRKAYLLALNNAELRTLMQDDKSDIYDVALRAADLADFLLCTRGKDTMLLVNNGDIVEGELADVDPARIVDTLGAGDRAHAAALLELLRGRSPEAVLASVAREAAEVIQYTGGHGDLYHKLGAVAVTQSCNPLD